MKILLVIDQFDQGNNGTTISARRFAQALAADGNEVRVAAAGKPARGKYPMPEIHFLPVADSIIRSQGMVFAKPNRSVLEQAIVWADVVHFMMPFALSRVGLRIAKEMGKPVTAAFHVQPENYALLGYSSGGQIAGVFCGKELGYRNYNVPKPGVLLLVYPINNFYEAKPIYHLLLDTHGDGRRYYDHNISDCIDADYPPTYFWYARNDVMLMAFNYWQQGPALQQALAANGVSYQEHVYRCAQHGVGIGEGTDAEGWIKEAAAFWEAHTAP